MKPEKNYKKRSPRCLLVLAGCLVALLVGPTSLLAGVVSNGGAAVTVDDFGRATQFQPTGDPNHLYELLHYVSVNGTPVQEVNAANFNVVMPIPAAANGFASSMVSRIPGDLQIQFSHFVVDGGVTAAATMMNWLIKIDFTNTTGVPMRLCYYLYNDFDLFLTPPNDNAQFLPPPFPFPGPAIRLWDALNPGSFLVQDLTARSNHYAIGAYPTVKNTISTAAGCVALPDAVAGFFGDYTGAMQYQDTIPAFGTATAVFMISRLF